MSDVTRPNGGGEAPESFAFSAQNKARAKEFVARYPKDRRASAILPLLDLAQRQSGGWLPRAAIEHAAETLDMPYMRAYQVASFYSMFNLRPVGRHFVQVCTTTPCWLCGSDEIMAACRETLGIEAGETTEDGEFTLIEVECLGACVNAPMMQVNDDNYEDLDAASTRAVLEALGRGETPKVGSQTGRQFSAPIGGPTTLKRRQSVGGS